MSSDKPRGIGHGVAAAQDVDKRRATLGPTRHHAVAALLQVAIKASAIKRHNVGHAADPRHRIAAVVDIGNAVTVQVPSVPLGVPSSAKIVPEPEVESGQIVHLGIRKLGLATVRNQSGKE